MAVILPLNTIWTPTLAVILFILILPASPWFSKNTLEVFEFSQIKHVDEAGSVRDVTLSDGDLNQNEISHVLNSLLHEVYITSDESKNVTLHF